MGTDEDEMIELSPERAVTRLGTLIMTAVGGLLAVLTAGSTGIVGPALTALLSILGAICALVFSVLYGRYIGVLGAGGDPEGSGERRAYDALRASLSHGSAPVRLYADTLKALLDAVDDFLGDAKMSERTLFPHAFGLKTPAPLWTAPAFDRCLLLAFIYPLATILVIWVASGHVGPGEEALQLARDLPGWLRVLTAAALLFATYAFCRSWRVDGWKRPVWIALGYASGVALAAASNSPLAGVVGVAIAGGVAAGVSSTGYGPSSITAAVTGTIAAFFAFVVAAAVVAAQAVNGVLAVAVAIVFAAVVAGACGHAVYLLNRLAVKHRSQEIFLSLFLAMTVLGCLISADVLSHLEIWSGVGPVLLYLGLLTVLKAPFDWASVGLTRALLRRGLELGGWWFLVLALIDALLAAFFVILLALAMVLCVQAFDDLTARGGGARILVLADLFVGIRSHPAAPEYWWVYAVLLSTMIPSLTNLMIGGASLMRGVPGLPSLLLRFMPAGKAVPAFERGWISLVLTLQIVAGVILGLSLQLLLALGVLVYIMPWLGFELLDMADGVAALDLPARLGQIVIGTL